ncbi:MAG: hypothetical protein D6729_01570 [Deltaproteobacteria bacterium]|nr:MAG: hypothetical protein D6729_01570 [Deltaproteobacteria bacterium]
MRWLVLGLAVGGLAGPRPAAAAVRPVHGGSVTVVADAPEAARFVAQATACTITDLLAEPPRRLSDGRRIELRLVENAFFQDGARITASDVEAAMKRWTRPDSPLPEAWRLLFVVGAAARLEGQKTPLGVHAAGQRTLIVDLAVPEVEVGEGVPRLLNDPRLPVTRAGSGSSCGPFRRQYGSRGHRIQLVAYEDHFDGRPFLDRIVLVPPGLEAAWAGPAPAPSATLTLTIEAPAAAFQTSPVAHDTYLLVRDPVLRRILAARLDPEALVRFLVGPTGEPLHGVAGVDLASAEGRTSAEADAVAPGAPPEATTVAFDPRDPIHRALAERVQLRLHQAGIAARLRAASPASGVEAPVAVVTVEAVPNDPALALVRAAFSFGDAQLALAVLRATAKATDDAALRTAAGQLSRRLPVIPLVRRHTTYRAGAHLQGLRPAALTPVAPAQLWLWPQD